MLAWRFGQHDLAAPPVPRLLRDKLRELNEWTFATFEPAYAPYDVDAYLGPAVQSWPDDLLLVAHDGHGISSWAIHYYLVVGPVACFLQLPWGGGLSDEQLDREAVNEAFGHVAELLDLPIVDGCRVVIVDSLHARAWSPVSADGTIMNWQLSDEPLPEALGAIRAGKLSSLIAEAPVA